MWRLPSHAAATRPGDHSYLIQKGLEGLVCREGRLHTRRTGSPEASKSGCEPAVSSNRAPMGIRMLLLHSVRPAGQDPNVWCQAPGESRSHRFWTQGEKQ